MKNSLLLVLIFVCNQVVAQNPTSSSFQYPPPVQFTSAQDHRNMMDQLGIKSLRPGPSGNESAPNHANYDESLATPYPGLPAPAQPNQTQLELINRAFRKLLSERDTAVKAIFDKYPAYNPITRVTIPSPFGGMGGQVNPNADIPSTQQLLLAGRDYA